MNVCSTYPCLRTAGGCPVCDRPPIYNMPAPPTFTPQGCICPPTSEKTCQSGICPRKNHLSAAGSPFSNGERDAGK